MMAMTSNSFKNLPLEILVEICSYLNIEDRKNVWFTCKSWYNAVHSPILWRSFTLMFVDAIHNCRNSVLVASKFGHCLKCLRIIIEPDDVVEHHRIAFGFFVDFLKILLETNQLPQLEKFSISGFWTKVCSSDVYEEAFLTTAKFLRTQKQLNSFSADLFTSIINGSLLLDSIDTQSLSTMSILDVNDLFTVVNRSCVLEILERSLKNYSNLTQLFLDWRYFGEKLLCAVANNCKNTLKYIHLTLFDDMDSNPQISVVSWENGISLIPDLRNGFLIDYRDDWELPLLKELFPSNLPIKDLDLMKNSIQPDFLHYCQNFSNTLEFLKLISFDDEGIPVDDEILKLITSCSNLRIFFFIGQIKMNTITSIIELRIQRVIGLQSLTITTKKPTGKEYEKATRLRKYYKNFIKRENIPFEFYISYHAFSLDGLEDSYSDSSSVEEEEEEITESSSEEDDEDIESNIDDESDTDNHA